MPLSVLTVQPGIFLPARKSANRGHTVKLEIPDPSLMIQLTKEPMIVIGDHVWVGADVFVLPGSTIGDGSIIGAHSVVKGRMPNNCTIAGNPAQVRRQNVAWERTQAHCEPKVSKQYYNATQPVAAEPTPDQQTPPIADQQAPPAPNQQTPPVLRMLRRAWRRLKKIAKKTTGFKENKA